MFWLQKGASFGKSQLLNGWTITDQNKKAYGGKIRISKASKLANIVKKKLDFEGDFQVRRCSNWIIRIKRLP